MVQGRHTGVGASTLSEEAINMANNNRRTPRGKRYRKPEYIMRTVLGSDLMTKRHRFKEVQVTCMKAAKTEAVAKQMFLPTRK